MMMARRRVRRTRCSGTIVILLISFINHTCLHYVGLVAMSETGPAEDEPPLTRPHLVFGKTRHELRRNDASVTDQPARELAKQVKETSQIRSQDQMPTGRGPGHSVNHETGASDSKRWNSGDLSDSVTKPSLQSSVTNIPIGDATIATTKPPRSVRSAEHQLNPINLPRVQALVGQQLIIPCSAIGIDLGQSATTMPARHPLLDPALGLEAHLNQQQHHGSSAAFQQARGRSSQLNPQQHHQSWATGISSGRHLATSGVSLIVWYKDVQLNEPIFVLDARNVESFREAKQQIGSESLKGRAHLDLIPGQQKSGPNWGLILPALIIDEATVEDSGVYTCDVEFPKAPTQTHQAQAIVVDQPKNMIVHDETPGRAQQRLHSAPGINLIGPYDEESNLVLSCEVEPGQPKAGYVTWWQLESVLQLNEASASSIATISTAFQPANSRTSLMQLQQLPDANYLTTVSVFDEQSSRQFASVGGYNQLIGIHPTIAHLERTSGQIEQQWANFTNNQANQQHQGKASTSSSRNRLIKHWRRLSNETLSAGSNNLDFDKPMRATLEVNNLSRANLNDEFMCLANNNNFSIPLNTTVKLNLNLRPTEVRIISKMANNTFKLGQKAIIECQVFGSKPSASIKWFRGSEELQMRQVKASNQRLDGTQVSRATSMANSQEEQEESSYISEFNRDINNNLTKISYLTLIPRLSDNQQSLTCSANNLKLINSPTISDTIQMNVQFSPRLNLQLNANIRPDSIKIGSDIFMECNVEANPPVDDLIWLLNDSPLSANVSLGIIMSNQSLVLQRIRIEQRGHYQCVASNSIGRSVSNKLELKPKFRPTCDYSLTKKRYEIPVNHATQIECHVLAEPGEDLHFVWHFNQTFGAHPMPSGDALDQDDAKIVDETDMNSPIISETSLYHLEELRQFETNFTKSFVIFTPKTRRHYGQLLCSASNSMGKQERPCIIQVVASELPDPVINCFTDNQTQFSFSVHCQPPANSQSSASMVVSSSIRGVGGSDLSTSGVRYILELYQDDASNGSFDAQANTHLKSRQPASDLESLVVNRSQQQPNRVKEIISDRPNFDVMDLRPNTSYHLQVFVQNSKGLSLPVYHQASTQDIGGAFAAGYHQFSHNDEGTKQGRVEFMSNGKRSSLSNDDSTGIASFSSKLKSYLRLDNYINDQHWQANQQTGPLISIGLILLLCIISIIVAVVFINKLCLSSGPAATSNHDKRNTCENLQSNSSKTKLKRRKDGTKRNSTDDTQQVNELSCVPRSKVMAKTNGELIKLTGTSIRSSANNSIDNNRLAIINLACSNGDAHHPSSVSARSPTTLGASGGSGSDTSRETNTDTTLISSPQTTLTNNASCDQSTSLRIIDGQSQQISCFVIGQANSDSMKRRSIAMPNDRTMQKQQQSYADGATPIISAMANPSMRSSSSSSRNGAFQMGEQVCNFAPRLLNDGNQHNVASASSSSSSPYTISHQQTVCLGGLTANERHRQQVADNFIKQTNNNALNSESVYVIGPSGLLRTNQLDGMPNYHQHAHHRNELIEDRHSNDLNNPYWGQNHQESTVSSGLHMDDNLQHEHQVSNQQAGEARCQLVDGTLSNMIDYDQQHTSNDSNVSFIPSSLSIPVGLSDRLQVLGRGSSQNDLLRPDGNCCARNTTGQKQHDICNTNGGSYLALINAAKSQQRVWQTHYHRNSITGSPFDSSNLNEQAPQNKLNFFTLGHRNSAASNSFMKDEANQLISPPVNFVNDFRHFKQTFGIENDDEQQRLEQDNDLRIQALENLEDNFELKLHNRHSSFGSSSTRQSLDSRCEKSYNNSNCQMMRQDDSRANQSSSGAKQLRVKFDDDRKFADPRN